jgi:hypothetical protein
MAPRGMMLGLNGTPFQPEQVAVQQVGTQYALCQGNRVLLEMGPRPDGARKLLDQIKVNRYDCLCRVGGQGKEGVTLLVRSR